MHVSDDNLMWLKCFELLVPWGFQVPLCDVSRSMNGFDMMPYPLGLMLD